MASKCGKGANCQPFNELRGGEIVISIDRMGRIKERECITVSF